MQDADPRSHPVRRATPCPRLRSSGARSRSCAPDLCGHGRPEQSTDPGRIALGDLSFSPSGREHPAGRRLHGERDFLRPVRSAPAGVRGAAAGRRRALADPGAPRAGSTVCGIDWLCERALRRPRVLRSGIVPARNRLQRPRQRRVVYAAEVGWQRLPARERLRFRHLFPRRKRGCGVLHDVTPRHHDADHATDELAGRPRSCDAHAPGARPATLCRRHRLPRRALLQSRRRLRMLRATPLRGGSDLPRPRPFRPVRARTDPNGHTGRAGIGMQPSCTRRLRVRPLRRRYLL